MLPAKWYADLYRKWHVYRSRWRNENLDYCLCRWAGGTRYSNSGSYCYGGKGGDGGECIIREPYSVSAGQTISITVGNGGSAGSNGTPTIIGNLVTLRGGGTTTGLVGAGVGGEGGFYYSDSSSNRGAEYGLDGVRGNGGTVADRSVRSSQMVAAAAVLMAAEEMVLILQRGHLNFRQVMVVAVAAVVIIILVHLLAAMASSSSNGEVRI